MLKYLYIYNYAPNEQQLCEMEMRRIFNTEMISKYYFSDQFFDYTRSVFMKGRLDIMFSAPVFKDIVKWIEEKQLCYYDFKVIYLKNDITHVDYQESLENCRQIAFPIDGSVNMQEPKVVFAITKIEDQWYFGIYHDDAIWHLRENKPYTYSHSLAVRDARTLVNIAIGHDLSLKVVDPCCGIGTVVLEALSMGVDIEGYDLNRDVAYQARMNLEHFGYNPHIIQRQDMRTIQKKYDVTIIDIPYGVYSPFTHQQQVSLLEGALKLAPTLVLVSHVDMNQDLVHLGYLVQDQSIVKKGNFKRYITLCLNSSYFPL